MRRLLFLLPLALGLGWAASQPFVPPTDPQGIGFQFRKANYVLEHPMRLGRNNVFQRGGLTNADLDTASHCFHLRRHYVELVRQDDPARPQMGLALGFEFDETTDEYPYTPARAVLQLKDFRWGGVEFGVSDTLNFTGVSDSVSDDLQISVDWYRHDTIAESFSGLLLSGSGQMVVIDSGWFQVKVYRRQ